MVHTFCVDGRYLALDVDSGTVHLLDEMSYEVISRWEKETPEQIVGELSGRFDEEELKEVIGRRSKSSSPAVRSFPMMRRCTRFLPKRR